MAGQRALFLAAVACVASAADPRAPHSHTGKLKPFSSGKPSVSLSSGDQASLDKGNMVMSQVRDVSGNSGQAMAIQAIHAPPKLVWKQLLDFNSYPKKVDKLAECSKYFEKQNMDGSKTIKARFLIKAAPGFAFEYYCDHQYVPLKKSLTWTLDYERESDFDDVVGHWYVAPHPSRPDWSQVYYSADLALKGWVPGVVMNILTNSALKSAVTWVKKFSEAEYVKEQARAQTATGFPKFPVAFGKQAPPPPVVVEEPKHVPLLRRPKVWAAAGAAAAVTAASVMVASCHCQDSPKEGAVAAAPHGE